ncbi:PIG-L deacetylase family protein, partial [Rhodoplanes roseus]
AEHGHRGAASYAMARRRELAAALALAGLAPDQVVLLGLPDQEVAEQMPVLARRLAAMCRTRGIDVVITHAMEGGHPDHDAVAFAVRAAAALADRDGYPIAVLEMPFYRRGPSGWLHQSFVPDRRSPATDVRLSDDEIALKRSMLAAHASQRATLAQFPVHVERFRPATPIDVTILPNDGALLYELYDWGLTGERWLALTGLACRTLGLGPVL